jgi:hypothetical protein
VQEGLLDPCVVGSRWLQFTVGLADFDEGEHEAPVSGPIGSGIRARHSAVAKQEPNGRCDDDLVSDKLRGRKRPMGSPAIGVLYALAMVAVVVGVDLLFFRHQSWFWERLAANVGIVLLFGAFYFRFLASS